jgi:hypothetical protein
MDMPKPPRSPLLGYNHNVKYGGHIFHVQTEDSGPGNPHLFTHLFFEGSILASKRGEYDPSTSEEDVRAMMQAQHKAILKELKQTTYNERISRFFAMRGETFPIEDFFADASAAPVVAVATPAHAAIDDNPPPAAAGTDVLDLDALPTIPAEKAVTPEPLPIHVTKPAVPGPGTYTFRRPTRERMPAEMEPAPPPPIVARSVPSSHPPVVRPITPVVVQRQVVVGGSTGTAPQTRTPSATPARRRPMSAGPYVVKEGSHANLVGASPGRKVEPPPRPIAPATDAAAAPRTAAVKPPAQEGAPSAFVTDQSLDDVILAYLSQGEGKR